MRIVCAGIFGWVALISSPLCGDGYSEFDEGIIAGKDPFSGDDMDEEGVLPESNIMDDSEDDCSKDEEKDITPEASSTQPREGKDVFFQETSPNNDDLTPQSRSTTPMGAKDVFPEERSSTGRMN